MDFRVNTATDASPEPQDREIVPAGIHVASIKHAEEGVNKFRQTDENPHGLCLKIRLSIGNYRFVFDDIPQHLGWRAAQLAAAVGITGDGSSVTLEPADLIGREVRVEVSHFTGKDGTVRATVKKYLPRESAARPKAVRRAAPQMAGDDIPF